MYDKQIDTFEFIDLINKSTCTFGLYINSPFCINNCKFCAYKGINSFLNIELVDYYNTLLQEIKIILPKIKDKNITSVYFGGGTPNLIPYNIFKSIVFLIKMYFPNIVSLIELSPTDSFDNLNYIKDNFDYIIFGVQSFNKNILDITYRKYISFEDFSCILNEIKKDKPNLLIGIDLLGDLCISDNWDRLKNDIEISKKLSNLDFMSVACNYYQPKSLPILKKYLGEFNDNRSYIIKLNNNVNLQEFRKHFYCYENTLDKKNGVIGLSGSINSNLQKHPTMSTLYINDKRYDLYKHLDKYICYERNDIIYNKYFIEKYITNHNIKQLLKRGI